MLKRDAIAYFGNLNKVRKALGLRSSAAVYFWGDIIPESSAGRLYVLSNHEIPYRAEDYSAPRRRKRKTGDTP
jgi:DNA-binding transcriptional regulator dicC